MLHDYRREAFHLFREGRDAEMCFMGDVGDGVRAEVRGVVVQ